MFLLNPILTSSHFPEYPDDFIFPFITFQSANWIIYIIINSTPHYIVYAEFEYCWNSCNTYDRKILSKIICCISQMKSTKVFVQVNNHLTYQSCRCFLHEKSKNLSKSKDLAIPSIGFPTCRIQSDYNTVLTGIVRIAKQSYITSKLVHRIVKCFWNFKFWVFPWRKPIMNVTVTHNPFCLLFPSWSRAYLHISRRGWLHG